jgi:hypothetical protein
MREDVRQVGARLVEVRSIGADPQMRIGPRPALALMALPWFFVWHEVVVRVNSFPGRDAAFFMPLRRTGTPVCRR